MEGRRRYLRSAGFFLAIALAIVPVNLVVFIMWVGSPAFQILATCQLLAGVGAFSYAMLDVLQKGKQSGQTLSSVLVGVLGMVVGLGGLIAMWLVSAFGHFSFNAMGSAWGRPLRLRGRILHPRLRAGSDWTRGSRPVTEGLDQPTRDALEALWLHDAQKEHASVPAFARISWLLAAVGAPAELVEGAHRAALEEIDHARRCFALAAGYGGRSHGVEPMPDLLVGGLDVRGDPLVRLATESLSDGCLLEDFNADVAAACESACREPAAKDVLARIAAEERSHASFSWALLEWLLARGDRRVTVAIVNSTEALVRVPRPTLVSAANASLVARADPVALLRHGRVPDEVWAELWGKRVAATKQRVDALVLSRCGTGDCDDRVGGPSKMIASLGTNRG